MFPSYTHLAFCALPATVHLYVLPVDVLRYISFTRAFATPDPVNAVAVVDVPVIPVPEYHCDPVVPVAPVAPCFATL